ncbi:MAG: response regulator [Actinobacteria bacterium]|nr:response regulator [Actinomycetota bacterium]
MLFDFAPVGYYISDLKGSFIDGNIEAEKITGYKKEELINKSFLKLGLLSKKDIAKAAKLLARNLIGQPTGPDEFTLIKKDGSKVITEISTYPIRINNSTYVLGVARDINEKKQAEENLKIAKMQAEKSALRALAADSAKSEFLANMSHEIRTPMNAIIGFSEILREQVTNPDYIKYIDTIITSGNTLLGLINDILDLSKIEAGKMDFQYRPVDPNALFGDIVKIFDVKIKDRGLKLITDIDDKLPSYLMLDEVRIRQILFNLVGNAVKFTDKGYIELKVKGVFYPDRSKIDLIFSVKDTGIRISEEDKKIIFDAFKQSMRQNVKKYGGTGLGLAITKKLVELMNGEITVESTVGKGSIFKVKIKEVSVASIDLSLEEKKLVGEDVVFYNQKVLIVDDIESNRLLLRELLNIYGLKVLEAENGKEAIKMAESKNPDIILMDLRMPVMDGYEAIKILKNNSRLKAIPIIVLTASAMKSSEDDIKKINCDSYIRKPVKRFELISELKKYLDFTIKGEVKEKLPEKKISESSVVKQTSGANVKLTEILNMLEGEISNKYIRIKKEFILNDIEDFAKEMLDFGKKYNLNIIIDWSSKLGNQAANFDLENLAFTINEFENILDKFKEVKGSDVIGK